MLRRSCFQLFRQLFTQFFSQYTQYYTSDSRRALFCGRANARVNPSADSDDGPHDNYERRLQLLAGNNCLIACEQNARRETKNEPLEEEWCVMVTDDLFILHKRRPDLRPS